MRFYLFRLRLMDSLKAAIIGRINYTLRRHRCECCGTWRGVRLREALTAYHYEGPFDTFADPNRRLGLCDPCHQDYAEFWLAMWQEYYASRG
jgi:hypothetical protein